MKDRATILFTPDGTGHCLYSEEIELQRLGSLTVSRAGHLEFNGRMQCWEVKSADCSRVRFRSLYRERCLAWERRNLLPAV